MLSLEGYVRGVRGLYEDLCIAQREVNTYREKYEALWATMSREHEKYRGSDALVLCEKSRNALRSTSQKLVQISGDLTSQIHPEELCDNFRESLIRLKEQARRIIDDYSAREGYRYLKTVRPNEPFPLYSTNARDNYFFFKASDSTVSYHLEQQEHSKLDPLGCTSCGMTNKPVVVEPLKGKGDYTSVGLFKEKKNYLLSTTTADEKRRFHVDVFAVETEKAEVVDNDSEHTHHDSHSPMGLSSSNNNSRSLK